MRLLVSTRCLAVIAGILVGACGGGDPTEPIVLTITPIGTIPVTVAGALAGDSIRVRVTDAGGAPKAGVSVTFTATAGGGLVSPASATTDAQGRAASTFTTGTVVGINTATASIAGSTAATFSVTTIAGAAVSIAVTPRIAFVDVGQRVTPTITALDANANAVAVSQLTIAARSPSAVSIAGDGSILGTGLAQTFVVVSSPRAADSLFVVVTQAGKPTLQSDLATFDIAHDTTFSVPVILDMRSSDKLGSTTVSIRWDPAQLTFVSRAEGANGAGALVNETGASQGVVTLALARPSGLAGRIELQRIVFKASGVIGKTGNLRLSLSELSAAATFVDLLPGSTSVIYPLIIR